MSLAGSFELLCCIDEHREKKSSYVMHSHANMSNRFPLPNYKDISYTSCKPISNSPSSLPKVNFTGGLFACLHLLLAGKKTARANENIT